MLIVCAGFVFTACEDQSAVEPVEVTAEKVTNAEATNSATTEFPNVPQEVVDKAKEVYGDEELPALTIAFTYTRGNTNIDLEDEWSYSVYSTPDQGCDVDGYYGYLSTVDGFTFLEERELCGEGSYLIDNRQGGWFDYVCGPGSFTIDYQGEPMIKLVRLWCE